MVSKNLIRTKIKLKKIDYRLINQLIGSFVMKGKRAYIERQFFKSLLLLKLYYFKNPMKILITLLKRLRPRLVLNSINKGRGVDYLPSFVENKQRYNLVLSWISRSVKQRKERYLYEKLFFEILSIFKYKGETVKKRRFHNGLVLKSKTSFKFLKEKNVQNALNL